MRNSLPDWLGHGRLLQLLCMWFIIIPIVGTERNEIDLAMILHIVSLLILTVFIIEVYILMKIYFDQVVLELPSWCCINRSLFCIGWIFNRLYRVIIHPVWFGSDVRYNSSIPLTLNLLSEILAPPKEMQHNQWKRFLRSFGAIEIRLLVLSITETYHLHWIIQGHIEHLHYQGCPAHCIIIVLFLKYRWCWSW